jgi:hypothetical protein
VFKTSNFPVILDGQFTGYSPIILLSDSTSAVLSNIAINRYKQLLQQMPFQDSAVVFQFDEHPLGGARKQTCFPATSIVSSAVTCRKELLIIFSSGGKLFMSSS